MTEDLTCGFGRVHRDLRISVTDRCNFRCTYCMPEEGMQWLPRSEVLTFEEIERVAGIMVRQFGVSSIRLTGGEPTLRAHLPVLVAKLAALRLDGEPIDLAMTTNGATLAHQATALREAGLRRINISLDTLRSDRFVELTRRDELGHVLDGVDAAVAAGFESVKVNAVVMVGVNDDEIVDLAEFGRERGVELRFIEFMPLDADGGWQRDRVMSRDEIVRRIAAVHPLESVARGAAPAERFRYLDGAGHVGVIASVTEPFCESCDRVRLTAEGALRNCLFALDEFDLRSGLRSGATDEELADVMRACVGAKWAGHAIGRVNFIRPSRSMSQLGG
ncbi:MAG: GTP 3',8-cyclase MoaA [Acidimicrobiales bacterium]